MRRQSGAGTDWRRKAKRLIAAFPLLWFACLLCLSCLPSLADDAGPSLEYQVKAAFLLNFTKFIEWPPASFGNAGAPLSICILGEDPFGATLDRIAGGEVVNGRSITIERVLHLPVPASCRVLFISRRAKEPRSPLDLGPGVLTVGEGEAFLREGGMIAFVIENRRVRFEINRMIAENAGFRISSKLLNIAKAVEK
ncbi:MAG TPA: YfiR family protein [Bryobacteraceae bacterium]|jgi:hypothetical protein|nr:YfiR family protein [Bryobacteraceae bacterium]